MTPPKKKHTLSALVENKFGVLARVAGMLSGRGFNIETLNVGPTHDPAYSRITATVIADDAALDRCVKALDKLINVITVHDFSREEVDHVARELILCKVKCDKKTRTEILEVAALFRAKVVDTKTALADPNVKAVVIASSTDTLADLCMKAARAASFSNSSMPSTGAPRSW